MSLFWSSWLRRGRRFSHGGAANVRPGDGRHVVAGQHHENRKSCFDVRILSKCVISHHFLPKCCRGSSSSGGRTPVRHKQKADLGSPEGRNPVRGAVRQRRTGRPLARQGLAGLSGLPEERRNIQWGNSSKSLSFTALSRTKSQPFPVSNVIFSSS